MNPRRLFRSHNDRVIAGIAGGMAEYLDVDPTVVRILWVLAGIFSGGLAILLYIILAFVVPTNPYQVAMGAGGQPAGTTGWGQPGATGYAQGGTAYAQGSPTGYAAGGAPAWSPDWSSQWVQRERAERRGRAGLIIGTVLIVIGVIALADVLIPGWIGAAIVGPAILLAIGAALLVASLGRRDGTRTVASAAGATEPAAAPAAPAAPPAAPVGAAEPAGQADPGGYVADATTTIPASDSEPA